MVTSGNAVFNQVLSRYASTKTYFEEVIAEPEMSQEVRALHTRYDRRYLTWFNRGNGLRREHRLSSETSLAYVWNGKVTRRWDAADNEWTDYRSPESTLRIGHSFAAKLLLPNVYRAVSVKEMLGKVSLGGHQCYVLVMSYGYSECKLWIDDRSLTIRRVTLDLSGQAAICLTYKHVAFDVDIPEDVFDFTLLSHGGWHPTL